MSCVGDEISSRFLMDRLRIDNGCTVVFPLPFERKPSKIDSWIPPWKNKKKLGTSENWWDWETSLSCLRYGQFSWIFAPNIFKGKKLWPKNTNAPKATAPSIDAPWTVANTAPRQRLTQQSEVEVFHQSWTFQWLVTLPPATYPAQKSGFNKASLKGKICPQGGVISVGVTLREDQVFFNRVGVQSKHKRLVMFFSHRKWCLVFGCNGFFVAVFLGGTHVTVFFRRGYASMLVAMIPTTNRSRASFSILGLATPSNSHAREHLHFITSLRKNACYFGHMFLLFSDMAVENLHKSFQMLHVKKKSMGFQREQIYLYI